MKLQEEKGVNTEPEAEIKRYMNGEIWDFEHEIPTTDGGGQGIVLGLDDGTTSTDCICMPMTPFSHSEVESLPILAHVVAGCSNYNSIGGWREPVQHFSQILFEMEEGIVSLSETVRVGVYSHGLKKLSLEKQNKQPQHFQNG